MPLKESIYGNNPFDLDNTSAYEAWKSDKLESYPQYAEQLIVEIDDPRQLKHSEREAILANCAKANMAVYVGNTGADPDKLIPATLGAQLGLLHLDRNMGADNDGITTLKVVDEQWRSRYIPYTNRPIHWHTDGYSNNLDQQIHSLLLHCVNPASKGGENALLDHEIAYIRLRDENPAYIQALMAPDVMTIPANIEQGTVLRPARCGSVFSPYYKKYLHMRYTARRQNIEWKNTTQTRAAVAALENLLTSDDPLIYRLRLQPGWGVISNNVLHDRSGFDDDEQNSRLLYRLRYFDRIN
ncbi:hypothetical protein MNBD_GAMMA15-1304 [hydrothermal vent metagenome]|uniref:TauD/TfdA-like domain-containing protein n=1 Tax=hydrothermal vent metagenome TaxID=652676 RepID=A0A3B0YRV7_9ZZZZ